MAAFRVFVVVLWLALVVYTVAVGLEHGWNLLPVFFGDIAAMSWPGQFNADFLGFLLFSGLWLAWRHRFSPGGLVLGVAGVFGGIGLLAPYLFWATGRANGDWAVLFLGEERARERG